MFDCPSMTNTWSGSEPGAHLGAGVGGTIGSGGGGGAGGGAGAAHLPAAQVQCPVVHAFLSIGHIFAMAGQHCPPMPAAWAFAQAAAALCPPHPEQQWAVQQPFDPTAWSTPSPAPVAEVASEPLARTSSARTPPRAE